jgi:hypothetical protein
MRKMPALAILAVLLLGGCDHAADGSSRPPRHGRYAGIGVFAAGDLWQKMVLPKQAAVAAQAKTADDEHVIVVVDSDSGEIRECGDLTGYCVSMNPWTRALAPEQRAPVALSAHAADLAAEAATNAADTNDPPPRQH